MKVLAVETATSWHSVALLDDGRVLARHDQDATGVHGALLLPTIDRLLTETGLRLGGLDGLACSIGPGSFTGIRVGLSTCLGLRAATDLPLVVVPTLEAMAWGLQDERLPMCPVLPSRKNEVYWALFRWADNRMERIVPDHVGSPQALAAMLSEPTVVFGDGWTAMETVIRAAAAPSVTLTNAPASAGKPSAVAVGAIGLEKLRRGELAPIQIAPSYVQRAEAELKYEQSGGQSPVARRQERVRKKVAERFARGSKGRRRGRTIDG